MSDKTCRNCARWGGGGDATDAPCWKQGYDKNEGDTCPDHMSEAEAAVDALKQLPITETLPLVKQWLAGEGFGVARARIRKLTEGSARLIKACPFITEPVEDGRYVCDIQANTENEYLAMIPDPSKCPAMIRAAKGK